MKSDLKASTKIESLAQALAGSTQQRGCASALKTLALMLGLLLAASSVQAAVLYQEDFPNSTSNKAVSTAGWSAYNTSSAAAASSNSTFLAYQTGNPDTSTGFLAINTGTNAADRTNYAVVTTYTDFAGGTSMDLSNSTITWVQGNDSASTTVRLLIQTGGNGTVGNGTWYASSTSFTTNPTISSAVIFASTATATLTNTITFSLTASNWNSFTLAPSSSMSLGGTLGTDLTTSTITGIGFYVDTPTLSNSVSRLDTLTVTVPEPATWALLAFSLTTVMVLRRRRNC